MAEKTTNIPTEVTVVDGDLWKAAAPSAAMELSEDAPAAIETSSAEYRDPLTRPIHLLSVKLIDTYKHINKVYYDAKAKKLREQSENSAGRTGVKNNGYDNADYDYIVHNDTGEIFNERYIIKHKLGKGSFGQVFCAYDQVNCVEVAIKIIKSRKPFTNQAQIEIELLRKLKDNDTADEMNIVHLLDTFMHHEHQCLVFEMMSYNLYDLLKNTRFKGVSLNLIRKFAKQILKALEYLASPAINVIHCDLKPENILLKHPRRSAIKLIDFGSSCYFTKKTYSYIQSRFYRSPEILLGTMNYSQKIDMWSLGCVLVEMHTGEPLFGGTDALDQLTRIIQMIGPLPFSMADQAKSENKAKYFTKVSNESKSLSEDEIGQNVALGELEETDGAKQVNATDEVITPKPAPLLAASNDEFSYFIKHPAGVDLAKYNKRSRSLADAIGVFTDGPYGRRKGEAGHTLSDYQMFHDMIKKMLVYDPDMRISPTDALKEPFMLQGTNTTSESQTNTATPMTDIGGSSSMGISSEIMAKNAELTTRSIPFKEMSLQSKESAHDKEASVELVRRVVRPSSAPSSLTPHGSKRRIGAPEFVTETITKKVHTNTGASEGILSTAISSPSDVKSPDHKVAKNTPPASP